MTPSASNIRANLEYQFLLTRLNGDPCLNRFEHCASDEEALATALRLLGPNSNKLRLEVWREGVLIYMGLRSKKAPPMRAERKRPPSPIRRDSR